MASYTVYDKIAERSKSINVEFLGSVLAESYGTTDSSIRYYFRISTSARTTDGGRYQNVLVLNLDELSLNGVKQRRTNTAVAYTDIDDMIQDYIYDFVNGHAANLYGSGVSYRAPMQF